MKTQWQMRSKGERIGRVRIGRQVRAVSADSPQADPVSQAGARAAQAGAQQCCGGARGAGTQQQQ